MARTTTHSIAVLVVTENGRSWSIRPTYPRSCSPDLARDSTLMLIEAPCIPRLITEPAPIAAKLQINGLPIQCLDSSVPMYAISLTSFTNASRNVGGILIEYWCLHFNFSTMNRELVCIPLNCSAGRRDGNGKKTRQ